MESSYIQRKKYMFILIYSFHGLQCSGKRRRKKKTHETTFKANEAEKGVAYCLVRKPSLGNLSVFIFFFLMDLARSAYTLTEKPFLKIYL